MYSQLVKRYNPFTRFISLNSPVCRIFPYIYLNIFAPNAKCQFIPSVKRQRETKFSHGMHGQGKGRARTVSLSRSEQLSESEAQ